MKVIRQGIVSRKTDSFFSYQAWPTACIDENGVIYVVASACRMGHVCPFGKILMYKSRDGGRTFSLPSIVQDGWLDDRDPGIIYLGDGKMLLTRCSHPAERYEKDFADWLHSDSGNAGTALVSHYGEIPDDVRLGGCFYRLLYDYGEKAGEEKRIPVHSTHGPVLLKDGTIFYLGKGLFPCDENEGHFSAYVSRDGGETFEKLSDCPFPEEYDSDTFHEVHCGEFEGGRIVALFRSHLIEDDHYFTIMKTYSDDGGKTWSKWEKTGICGSPPHICALSDGRAALTYGRRIPPYGIYARLMSPSGKIGDEEIMLAQCRDNDIGYPASVQLPDGTVFTAYYSKYGEDKRTSILYSLWSTD